MLEHLLSALRTYTCAHCPVTCGDPERADWHVGPKGVLSCPSCSDVRFARRLPLLRAAVRHG